MAYEEGSAEHIATAKSGAIEWAQRVLGDAFVILDYETNGLPGEPVQIAIVDHRGRKLMDTLVKPDNPAALLDKNLGGKNAPKRSAYDIHGIHPDDLVDAPTFHDIYEQWFDLLNDRLVVAYNVSFESKITSDTCTRLGLTPPTVQFECAMLAYADYYGDWNVHPYYGGSFRWQKLEEAHEREGLRSVGMAHDALTDVRMTLNIMRKMAGVDNTITIQTAQMGVTDPDMMDITVKSARTNIEKLLAPTWEMVRASKSGAITWQQYTDRYYRMMRHRYRVNKGTFDTLLTERERIVLKCYCGQPDRCHRSLAVDILTKIAESLGIAVNDFGEVDPPPPPTEQPSLF